MYPTSSFESFVERSDKFPLEKFARAKDLLIIDKNVLVKLPGLTRDWRFVYAVEAGEELKSFAGFAARLEQILELWKTPISRSSRIVAVGGGSVGDFAGFIASVLKRGVRLEHVPSTWLAAIDSAHGGKTALNVGGVKNQIGTFYPAQAVHLVREILDTQPEGRALEGLGELVKIALLEGDKMFAALIDGAGEKPAALLWKLLEPAIAAKYAVVRQDPQELSGARKILNLGHTMGHVFEAAYGRSHGESVTQGLWFALEWSRHKNILSSREWDKIRDVFVRLNLQRWTDQVDFISLEARSVLALLAQDKKMTADDKVDFVFLRTVGGPVVQPVMIEEIMLEGIRQGWVRGAI